MGAQCVAVGRNSDGHTKSCLGRDCTIRLFAYKPTNNYNAPTCSDAKVDDDSWISVPPKTLATYRQQALSNLGRSLRGHHDFTKKDLRLCWNIFKWWPGSAARGNSVWRNPDTGRYKLELFPGHGFALPVFETVVEVVEVPEVVSRPVTRQATAAVAEEKADADSGGTPVRTVRPSAAAILITPPAPR
jgi:hypothetical protein